MKAKDLQVGDVMNGFMEVTKKTEHHKGLGIQARVYIKDDRGYTRSKAISEWTYLLNKGMTVHRNGIQIWPEEPK